MKSYKNYISETTGIDLNDILPKTFNKLFYTRRDFINMLKQVLTFYYDEFGIKFLGSGAEGDAFKITSKDQTKVLKITNNIKEASAIEKVRKYNIRGLVDYYDVRKIVDSSDIYLDLYAILMDSVEPLDKLEKTVWTFLRGYFFNFKEFEDSSFLLIPGPKTNFKQFILTNNKEKLNKIYNNYKKNIKLEQIYYIYDKIEQDLMTTDIAYQTMLKFYENFCELTYDAIKYKLKMRDFHVDNAGKDIYGNLKFFDVLSGKKSNLKLKNIEVNLNT